MRLVAARAHLARRAIGAAQHNISSPDVNTTYTAIYAATVGNSVPGTIQVEDFDEGTQNQAYFDTSTSNEGGDYRNTRVDIDVSGDSGGGFCITT